MENFVAVKPSVDLTFLFTRLRPQWDELVKRNAKSELQRFFQTIPDQFQKELMQEALLFDKIYLVGPNLAERNFLEALVRELTSRTGDLLAFIDIDALLHELNSTETSSDDFWQSISALRDFLDSAVERQNLYWEALDEYNQKFPEIVLVGEMLDDPNVDLSVLIPILEKLERSAGEWKSESEEMMRKLDQSIVDNVYPLYDYYTRVQALKLEHFEKKIATPLLSYASYEPKLPSSRRHDIIQLVIHELPLPDTNTPWERIIEYRDNPDNRKALLALRRWIRKFSTEDMSLAEATQELEWLQHIFQEHMKLHEIKADTGTLEVMVKAPLEVLENLVTLKFSKFVDPLFAIKKRRIALLEAELNAPGREISYLVKAKESF